MAALADLAADSPPPTARANPASVRADRARGQLREADSGPTLRHRAWPMALALALVLFAGFVTEMVGASQMMYLAGPLSLVVMYPLGGVGLLLVALLMFRVVDQRARLSMLRRVLLGYGAVFAVALALLAAGAVPAGATGLAWLLADQLMFLIPGLLWSLAGDEFNVAEARRVFPWIVSWSYAGQLAGLLVATVSPMLLTAAEMPLPILLVVDPVICIGLGLWLPRRLSGTGAATGLARAEDTAESLRSAWEFVRALPVWRAFWVMSVLALVAGMTAHLSFMAGAEWLVGPDPADVQTLLAGVSLVAFVTCWPLQRFAAQRIQGWLGIPGTLLILPVAAVGAGVALALGALTQSIVVMAVGISLWRIPKWSVDENARRAALALVPDERRARVSFLMDLAPTALGLILSGAIALAGLSWGSYWLAPAIAAVIAAAAVVPGVRMRRGWDDSLLSWRLRRRKANRIVDLG